MKGERRTARSNLTLKEKHALRQLELLLQRNPAETTLDVDALIIDYLGRSGQKLESVLKVNPLLYAYLFGGSAEHGRRLLQALGDPDIVERCQKKYPLIARASNTDGLEKTMADAIRNPETYLSYAARAVVWQISDVHFGKFYKLKETPRELAYFLAQISREHPALKPDTVVICGDVSSIAIESEFNDFLEFCNDLSHALWKAKCPERILVVPGNHDVTWAADGTADKMAAFKRKFSSDSACVTPFGKPEKRMGNGRFKIVRVNPHPNTIPPVAVVFDEEKQVRYTLLVSGFFSGNVPLDVRTALNSATGSTEDLLALLRVDEGEVKHEYLSAISDALGGNTCLGIGVIHHNPVPYGVEMSRNPLAPKLMETLWMNKVPLLLHGHIHLGESRSNKRPAVPGQAYPIPVSTLTSVTTAGGARGINIHFIGVDRTEPRIDTLMWNISQSMAFRVDDAAWRYRISVTPETCKVEHL
jgi:3',5'-cyclic AMP phosphodiesterase CpdA